MPGCARARCALGLLASTNPPLDTLPHNKNNDMSNPTIQIAARSSAGIVQPVQATPDGALRVTTGFAIPLYDKTTIAYHGATNNSSSVTYSLGATNVARVDFGYVGGVPTTDNAKLASSQLVLL